MGSNDLWATALRALNEEDRNLVEFEGQRRLEVLSELGQLVTSAKENSIEKRWRFHRSGGGQTVILRDLFSKIVNWINRFKDLGDIVVQYDPVHATLPWAGVRFLLQIAVSDINKFGFIVEGAEKIAYIISRYATFEQIYLGYDTTASCAIKGLEEALIKLYAAILVYLAKAKMYFEESTPKRMVKAVITSQSDFEALLRSIDNELEHVDHQARLVDAERTRNISNKLASLSINQDEMHAKLWELMRSIDSPICRMGLQLDNLEDQLKHSERVEILRWLSPQPYMDHHKQIKKQALPGSGQWLLRDPLYLQWYKQSVSSLLWLHGKPGSGKSTLVSLVIEDMIARFEAGQSALPVFFYCSRSAAEPERSNPHAVLASILRQLSCVQAGAPILGPVIEKYKRQGEGFKSNGLDLDDSLDLIIRLVEDYSMSIIIVDALDECDPSMRQSLLDAFERILKDSAGLVKIFVSSRNDQDIVWTLRENPNMDISSDKNTADIETYVEREVSRLVKTGQLLRNSRATENTSALIIEQVSNGADGMFRWASLQLDVLRVLKLDEDIRARLGKLPPKLEELYLEVYNNLISAQGEVGRSIIVNALKWLLCAKEELHASEFLLAVAASLETFEGGISVDSLLDLCNNFVLYDEALDVFRFAHLSVREFLEQKPEYMKTSCYSLAAGSCLLQIIASSDCPNTEHLMSDEHLLRLREIQKSAKSSSDASFLKYANNSWMEYCRLVPLNDRLNDSKFGQIFRSFLSDKKGSASPLNAWIQWYCSRVITERNSAASLKLQALLITNSDPLSRPFFVATCFGFSEILAPCVKDRGLSVETKDQGLLLAAMAQQPESFDIISQTMKNWAMTEPLLVHAVRAFDKARLAWLLDRAPDTMITNRVFSAVAQDSDDGKMTVLLDRYPDISITEKMLEVAVRSISIDNFISLVARAAKPVLTEQILRRYPLVSKPKAYFQKIVILLDRMKESDLTPDLMVSAVESRDERIVQAILERGGAGIVTEAVIFQAARRGPDIFLHVLQNCGKITERVLDLMASQCDGQVWQLLLEQDYEFSINVQRLKLAALNKYHGDAVLSVLLEHTDSTIATNDMAGLIREVARSGRNGPIKQLLDHCREIEISQEMLLAATLNWQEDRPDRVKMFLERSSQVLINEDMLVIAASDENHAIELIQMFLTREGRREISEYVLMTAACNTRQGYEIMQLLLEQDISVEITEEVLVCAAKWSRPDLLVALLGRSSAKVPMGILLRTAAANLWHGGDLVKLLLERAKITEVSEAVFINAVESVGKGKEVIQVLEKAFGRINLTESLIAKCFQKGSHATVKLLLDRVDPVRITEEALICAIRNINYYSTRAVVEKSLHIPITTQILVSAAQYGSLHLFRFLWNRYPSNIVSEDLTVGAAKGRYNGCGIMEFLLVEADRVEVGEATLIALVSRSDRYGSEFFDLLLERGLQVDTTEDLPKTLLTSRGIKVRCSSPTPLQLNEDMRLTEDTFRIAASQGNERLLKKLATFCEMDGVPRKWLDIARLSGAARFHDNELVEIELERCVEPDAASPDGYTPLAWAVYSENPVAVQMLLSAGALPDGGPNLKVSPLCYAARRGEYDLVKILVNAGASLDFRDRQGQTPSMIAKSNRQILVFKYLKECRKEQEGRRKELTPEST